MNNNYDDDGSIKRNWLLQGAVGGGGRGRGTKMTPATTFSDLNSTAQ